MRDRLLGLLLFLPVPAVLVLYTQAPLGPLPSLAAGIALMASHRFYARPFALARAGRRCLWCGGAAADGPALAVEEPFGETRWRACGEGHARAARRFLAWTGSHRRFVQAGILGTLAAFLVLALAAALRPSGGLRYADAVNFFRVGIAATVLPLSVLGVRGADGLALRTPFPLHVQALIGTAAVLWLFRLVGVAWLALAVVHFATR
jgi:hypothetical protein